MPSDPALLERANAFLVRAVPLNAALGMSVVSIDEDHAEMHLPYREDLVGDPETGVLHGGMVTSLLDACCGNAVLAKTGGRRRVATLDLRIDYLRPATPHQTVVARAECYKLTKHVAFVRALAHHGDPADLIASAAGTFVVFEGRS